MTWPTGDSRVLQFGTGRFVRGFFEPLVSRPKSITVLQSRPAQGGANAINELEDGYHLWVRGIWQGQEVDQVETIRSLDQAYSLTSQWPTVLQLATDPNYQLLISNTTEKGLVLEEADAHSTDWLESPPASFPARLLAWLYQRYTTSGQPITVMPLELIEFNAERLRELLKQQADLWEETRSAEFQAWLFQQCRWLSTLVDRICVDPVPPTPWETEDPLAVMTEPFRMLAIADDGGDRSVVPDDPSVIWTDDLRPYFLQKVRLLNGLHTAIVAKCLPLGFEHVIDVMNDPEQEKWVLQLMYGELVPTLEAQGLQVKSFADAVIERFRNPFFKHRLSDIAFGHETKLQVRLQPTLEEHKQYLGTDAPILEAVMAMPLPVVSP